MEPNVVALSLMLTNLRLEISVPVNAVPVHPVPPVAVDVDENQEPPGMSRSTVVRRFEDPAFLSEGQAVRSLPFRMTR